MTGEGDALRRCVGDPEAFVERVWGAEPLLHHAEEGFGDLLDLGDVDHLVTETLLRMPSFRLVRDGTPLDPSAYTQTIRVGGRPVDRTIRPERVAAEFEAGATIVLQALHRQWPPVAEFCRDLELTLTHPVQANAYVTPPTAQGFAVHHDTHDVFVLQSHGRKRWRVYRPVVELAGPEQPWKRSRGDPGEPVLEADLTPGDALYLPRGFPHEAEAQDDVSIHVTVGILAHTWLDLWRHLLRRAADHRPFREALPPGFARTPDALEAELGVRLKELHDWLDDTAGPETVAGFARGFWSRRRPMLSGQLHQLRAARAMDEGTPVRRRPGSVFVVSVEGDEAVVVLGRTELRMPAFCEPALRFVAEARDPVSASDLPGLDPGSALVLVRRLVREGALEVEGARRG
ncbi:MAG TPA: cupin domain-containing protein [Actinomycetota bacterium]|nr:cupin domain-containing protein [Actinomycetota bacterium]